MMERTYMELPAWAEGLGCAVTVADITGNILFMNARARDTFRNHGNLIGRNLHDLHNERSCAIIDRILSTGQPNAYTIEKEGVHKFIYQTPWRDSSGAVAGVVELSMVVPAELPHYVR